MITINDFQLVRKALGAVAEEDIAWSENIRPPTDPMDFALETIFVICNSGMKNTIARKIYERVRGLLLKGQPASDGFGHPGKVAAIQRIWDDRAKLFAEFNARRDAGADMVEWCETLPWIGGITKFHLAKNFGVDCAKPDVHLQRLADREGLTAQALCDRLAEESGLRAATIDVVLWRACANGVLNSRTGEINVPGEAVGI